MEQNRFIIRTLKQFTDYFAPCGFRKEAFFPCYGLAEATLMVVGGPKARPPLTTRLAKSGLEQNRIVISQIHDLPTHTIVSCGPNMGKQKICIVDVETHMPCPPEQVGEIWLSGPCVANGYWNKPQETLSAFNAFMSLTGEGPFLRTGDLGFVHDGELYVTGRLKNMIIIDGKNHYPHDIEKTVEMSHAAIVRGGCAVFSVDGLTQEHLIVMAENSIKACSRSGVGH
jgi:acyl-CoA synthetase (AMP-forming)/AMP-acid ligase II